ncbi:methyltransferase [Alteromonas facilis]|uniref:methyltransferase n=1 Tax=Alteromonas facilis TaxID=2048004 RepID=UPI000C29354F|nr:methyltransferase [Alteromonas facilis]
MLSGADQLLIRNEQLFAEGNWVFINPSDGDVFDALQSNNIDGFHQYYTHFQRCEGKGRHQSFGTHVAATQDLYDGAVIYLPQSKPQANFLIDNARSVVKAGGTIAIVGGNDSGIKSVGKRLKQTFGEAQKYDAARHCAIWLVENPTQFAFNLNKYLKVNTYSLKELSWQVASLPGVFSADGLDPGTELLLSSLPTITGKTCLDFACGAGVVGSYLNLRQPQLKVYYSDINALALYCCEHTLRLNNLEGEVIASNGLNQWQRDFDNIVSNPPFHSGKETDYSITEQFIRNAKDKLSRQGHLFIVANRFLPYPELIDQNFNRQPDCQRSNKFSVYHAIKK